jgi:hypothetical protein
MSDILRMKSVEPVLHGVVKIVWLDGYEAIVDFRPIIAEGNIFAFLRGSPERFSEVKLADFGHAIYWLQAGSAARTRCLPSGGSRMRWRGLGLCA